LNLLLTKHHWQFLGGKYSLDYQDLTFANNEQIYNTKINVGKVSEDTDKLYCLVVETFDTETRSKEIFVKLYSVKASCTTRIQNVIQQYINLCGMKPPIFNKIEKVLEEFGERGVDRFEFIKLNSKEFGKELKGINKFDSFEDFKRNWYVKKIKSIIKDIIDNNIMIYKDYKNNDVTIKYKEIPLDFDL